MVSARHALPVIVCVSLLMSALAPARAADGGGMEPRLVVQTGHLGPVFCVDFSPDASLVASGSKDETVRLWHVATGAEIMTLSGHTDEVRSVAFSPDGSAVASGSSDNTVRIWDAATGKQIGLLSERDSINSIDFSPDGRMVASGGWDRVITLWDVATGAKIATLKGHTASVVSLAFSPDGRLVASGSTDRTAKVWDVTSGREINTLPGHTDQVMSVAFSPDGSMIATGSWDETVAVWDTATGKRIKTLSGHDLISSVAFAPDGRAIVVGSGFRTVELWDVAKGEAIRALSGRSFAYCLACSGDGKMIASASYDNGVCIWDAADGKEIRRLSGRSAGVVSSALRSDGGMAACGSWDGAVRLWALTGGGGATKLSGHRSVAWSTAFGADGALVASGSQDRTVRIYSVATGADVRTLSGHTGFVSSVAFARGGGLIASGSGDRTVRLWDVSQGKELRTLSGHTAVVRSVAFSPDGRQIASGSDDQTIRLWDAVAGKEIKALSGHTGYVWSVAFSPDGSLIASGSSDRTAKLWDVSQGKELRTLSGHTAVVHSVAFSPDGRTIATGSYDNTIRLWDVVTGRAVRKLGGLASSNPHVSFAADGRTIASRSGDGSIKLWSLTRPPGKELLCSLYSFTDGGWAVVDPEGRYDSSNNGEAEGIHWCIGNEPIELWQMKGYYWVPGLLKKLMDGEKLPPVVSMKDAKLYPEIVPALDGEKLSIKLTDQGGGIGPVTVMVNGKVVVPDARPRGFDTKQKSIALPTVDLSRFRRYLLPKSEVDEKDGRVNRVEVFAWNSVRTLSSRIAEVPLPAPAGEPQAPRTLYAVVAGVSGSGDLALEYPCDDARAIADVMRLGADGAFERSRIVLLTSDAGPQDRPTARAIRAALYEVRENATARDVVLVYLAGHGVTWSDGFYFLAEGATDASLGSAGAREKTTVSGAEIAEALNSAAANRIALILDTCSAGKMGSALGGLTAATAHASSDARRAWERMRGNTGLFLLAGCGADASSHEHDRYRHGILTYSLLKGLVQAREETLDGPEGSAPGYLNVRKWFEYAQRTVPSLARAVHASQQTEAHLGLKQFAFHLARFAPERLKQVPFTPARPAFLRAKLVPKDGASEISGLVAAVDQALVQWASRGVEPVADSEPQPDEQPQPGDCQLSGVYVSSSGTIRMEGSFLSWDKSLRQKPVHTFELEASDIAALVSQIVTEVEKWSAAANAQ